MALADEYNASVGHRKILWDAQTDVHLTITEPKQEIKPMAVLAPVMIKKTDIVSRGQELRELIAKGEVTVTFTKQNGDRVEMRCTTKEDLIPMEKRPKVVSEETLNTAADQNLFKVYATDRQGWRSFRLERVSHVQVHVNTKT